MLNDFFELVTVVNESLELKKMVWRTTTAMIYAWQKRISG
jgi:hypothetical protein